MNVGANIRRIRLEKDISQAQLARQVGISPSMLCQIERGTKMVTVPLGVEIAAALQCDLDCPPKILYNPSRRQRQKEDERHREKNFSCGGSLG